MTAEKLAEQTGITRKDSDAYALRSQQAAEAAHKAGYFKEEIVPVEVKQGKKTILVSEDDHRRPETTMETLEKLPPSFKKDGMVTAGNASGIVDGAAAVVVTTEKIARERGSEADWTNRFLGCGGRRPEHHGNWAGAFLAQGVAACRIEVRTDRPRGSE